eukprot:3827035-Rhodomonas_salina.1
MPCPVLAWAMLLLVPDAVCVQARYAMPGTDIAHGGTDMAYAGTDMAYAGTRALLCVYYARIQVSPLHSEIN